MSRRRCSGPSNRNRMPFAGNVTMTGSLTGSAGEYTRSSFGNRCGSDFSRVRMSCRDAPRTAQRKKVVSKSGELTWPSRDNTEAYRGSPTRVPDGAAQRIKMTCSRLEGSLRCVAVSGESDETFKVWNAEQKNAHREHMVSCLSDLGSLANYVYYGTHHGEGDTLKDRLWTKMASFGGASGASVTAGGASIADD